MLSPSSRVDTPHLEGCIDTVFSQQPYEIATKTSGAELGYFLNSRKGLIMSMEQYQDEEDGNGGANVNWS